MVSPAQASVISRLLERLNLRFPTLFLLLGIFTLLDLLVPDLIPLVDEIMLAVTTALFGTWKTKRAEGAWKLQHFSPSFLWPGTTKPVGSAIRR